ncbi:MAG: hypothetical protein AAGG02_09310 [Cyanobacteria bacterium P01_H01_bin.15]
MAQTDDSTQIFRISPLIRLTLQSLLIALTVPLPFLAEAVQAEVPASWLWIGIVLGSIGLYGVLSERVILDTTGIRVAYPKWVLFRKGWSLPWSDVAELKLRTTGQGGLVYYFVTQARDRAYLLPMRVVGFAKLVKRVEQETEIDTSDVRPLAQPWMYLILLGFTGLMFLVDAWAIFVARQPI